MKRKKSRQQFIYYFYTISKQPSFKSYFIKASGKEHFIVLVSYLYKIITVREVFSVDISPQDIFQHE